MSRVLILGGGVSGRAAGRLAHRLGMSVTVYDRSPSDELIAEGFGIASGQWDHLLLTGVELVVASPGFSERSQPVIETLEFGVPLVSEVEFAASQIELPLAAVTGTNGKTTVTEATSAMLDASGIHAPVAGNIGAPLSDFVSVRNDALVVEVSSFQLRFTETFRPVAAAITNVAVDHLDWHGSTESYRSAKAKIYANQTDVDLLTFDADDEGARSLAERAPSLRVPASGKRVPSGGSGPTEKGLVVRGELVSGPLETGDPAHLVDMALAATMAKHLGATARGIGAALETFRPGAHRRQRVGEFSGARWINDSKATNPHAAIASVRAHESVILIAGGLAKGTDVESIAVEPNIKLVLGIGEAGPALVEAAQSRGRLAGTLEVAVEAAAAAAKPGDTVLLAPGCASFDQFSSYAARGERFIELVNERFGVSV